MKKEKEKRLNYFQLQVYRFSAFYIVGIRYFGNIDGMSAWLKDFYYSTKKSYGFRTTYVNWYFPLISAKHLLSKEHEFFNNADSTWFPAVIRCTTFFRYLYFFIRHTRFYVACRYTVSYVFDGGGESFFIHYRWKLWFLKYNIHSFC